MQPVFPASLPGVSIHAPTRRATLSVKHRQSFRACFNPRPHAEGDEMAFRWLLEDGRFNPRPHAEGDVSSDFGTKSIFRFNPRPHAEGDASMAVAFEEIKVSIHAPTRRATHFSHGVASSFHRFNPRPHAEGDSFQPHSTRQRHGFQSTPPRGGRPLQIPSPSPHTMFQSTPPRGGRRR